jgi:hypothetical protein
MDAIIFVSTSFALIAVGTTYSSTINKTNVIESLDDCDIGSSQCKFQKVSYSQLPPSSRRPERLEPITTLLERREMFWLVFKRVIVSVRLRRRYQIKACVCYEICVVMRDGVIDDDA